MGLNVRKIGSKEAFRNWMKVGHNVCIFCQDEGQDGNWKAFG